MSFYHHKRVENSLNFSAFLVFASFHSHSILLFYSFPLLSFQTSIKDSNPYPCPCTTPLSLLGLENIFVAFSFFFLSMILVTKCQNYPSLLLCYDIAFNQFGFSVTFLNLVKPTK